MGAYTRDCLIYVETYIEAFAKELETIVWEYEISHIPLSILRTIFDPNPEDDYELVYGSYALNENSAAALNSFLDFSIEFDFEKFDYYMARYGDYRI